MERKAEQNMPDLPPETSLNVRDEVVYATRLKLQASEFEDPGSIPQKTWRQMIRSRIFSHHPGFFVFKSFGTDMTMLGPAKLRQARELPQRKRAEFLDHYSFVAYESREVIVGRYRKLRR